MKKLKWKPKENIITGLNKTVKWYLNNPNWLKNSNSKDLQKWMKIQYK